MQSDLHRVVLQVVGLGFTTYRAIHECILYDHHGIGLWRLPAVLAALTRSGDLIRGPRGYSLPTPHHTLKQHPEPAPCGLF